MKKTSTKSRRKPTGPKRITRERFPALARFLSGYLHQDFHIDRATPAAAHRAFLADASPDEIRELKRESQAFLEETRATSWPAMRDAFLSIGGAWAPPSRAGLEQFLSSLAGGRATKSIATSR